MATRIFHHSARRMWILAGLITSLVLVTLLSGGTTRVWGEGPGHQPPGVQPVTQHFTSHGAGPLKTAPAMTCCEANVNFDFNAKMPHPAIVAGGTSLVGGLYRTVTLQVDFPIELDCAAPRVKDQHCIGRFNVAISTEPTQPGGVGPTLSSADVVQWGDWPCNTGHHRTTVRVQYTAVYPGNGAVTGNLTLTLTLPAGKTGTINHTYTVDLNARSDGNTEKVDATPNNNPDKDPKKDSRDPQPIK